MRRLIAIWTLILAWGLMLPATIYAADSLVHAKNFQTDAQAAAKRQMPIMVLFTTPDCPYCARVKRDYLVPMHKDRAYRSRVLIREVTINTNAPLTGFNGMPTTESAFSAGHKVYIVPTVMVFDAHGKPTGEPIVGQLIPDFYFGYLEAAIDEGIRKVQNK